MPAPSPFSFPKRRSAPSRRAAVITAVAALLLGAAVAPPSAIGAQSRAELERIIRRHVLANGLEVIVVENHGVPLATVELDVKNGAFTQTPSYAGLAHMYEHMFFKANATYRTPDAFTDRAAELGAMYNGTTQEERVNYYLTLPADSVAGGIRFLAAAAREPFFREDELAREKEVVLGEYDRAESSPFFALDQRMTAALYPGNASRKDALGDRTVIRNVTPAQMETIRSRYYVPNNTALIVTGDVDPARVFALAEEAFGDWRRGEDPFVAHPIPPIPDLPGDTVIIEEAPVSTVSVLMQWQGPSVRDDPGATYAADVFSDALNTPGSPFRQRLVDSGLWDEIVVNYYTLAHKGPISISGQVAPERLRDALAALDREIAQFADPGYVSAEAMRSVQAQRATSSAFGIERASGVAHTIGFWWSVADLDYFLGYVDNMAAQTSKDLQRYARTYIVGKPRVTGVLLSPQAATALDLSPSTLRVGEPVVPNGGGR